jgi:hypothetical protein
MTRRDFNWGSDNANVVLRAYGSIAVHENPYGDVVVRQEREALEEDDHWVVIPVQDAELIAQAIIDKASQIKAEWKGDEQRQPEAQQRLALPAPNGTSSGVPKEGASPNLGTARRSAPLKEKSGSGAAAKIGAA